VIWEYRDYTPASWNVEKKVCTLYIEAGHQGAGSRWIQQLKPGDEILLGPAHAAQLPAQEGNNLVSGRRQCPGAFFSVEAINRPGPLPDGSGGFSARSVPDTAITFRK
jgi:hypothetical protein